MITAAFIMSGLALGIITWHVFIRKAPKDSNVEMLEKKVKYLQDNAALVIEGDGDLSDAIIMHNDKVIYIKLKNEDK